MSAQPLVSDAPVDSLNQDESDEAGANEVSPLEGQWDFLRNDLPDLGSFQELVKVVTATATASGVSATLLDPSSADESWSYKFDGRQVIFVSNELMVIETLAPIGSKSITDDLRASGWTVEVVKVARADGECGAFADQQVSFLQCRHNQTDVLLVQPVGASSDRLVTVAQRTMGNSTSVGPAAGQTSAPGLHIPDAFADALLPFPLSKNEPLGQLASQYDDPSKAIQAVRELVKSAGIKLTGFDIGWMDHSGGVYLGGQSLVVVGPEIVAVQSLGAMTENFIERQISSLPDGVKAQRVQSGGMPCVTVVSSVRASLVCTAPSLTLTLISAVGSDNGSLALSVLFDTTEKLSALPVQFP
ncbi:unannotated protein [freshwater metagenome]|uniref:Unannotated protein n=1 Tax=freshwater metagenome TaxID=449393 RepID=A0A6J7FPN2_9ZZZZ|nr:hypothetical protein [Actinomycetota bacterium]